MINFLLNNTLATLIPAGESKSTDFLAYLENEGNSMLSDPLLANESTVTIAVENPTSNFFLLLKDTLKEQEESENSPLPVIVNGSQKIIQDLPNQEVSHLENTDECEKIVHLQKILPLEQVAHFEQVAQVEIPHLEHILYFEKIPCLEQVDHFENIEYLEKVAPLQRDPEKQLVLNHEEKDGIPDRENNQPLKKDSQPVHYAETPAILKAIKKEEIELIKEADKIENTAIEITPSPLERKINIEKVEKIPVVLIKEIRLPIQSQAIKIEREHILLPLENRRITIEKNQENNPSILSQTTGLIEIAEIPSSPDIIGGEVASSPKQALSFFDQVLVKTQTNDASPYEVFQEKLFNEIRFLIGNEKSSATISMDPPELGKIEVEVVQINEKTHVLFRVDTENTETKVLIENTFSKLTDQFSVNGMALGDLAVTQEDFSQTPRKSPEANYLTFSSKQENMETEKEIIKTVSSLHLLDLYV